MRMRRVHHQPRAEADALSMAFPPGYADCRKSPRYDFKLPAKATIYPPQGCEDQPAQVCDVLTRDLSSGGICFLHSVPLFQSQRVDLEMPDGRKFKLEIRRVTRVDDGRFVIGCRFAKITGPSQHP